MIENIDAGTVLFLDIETVSAAPTYDELGETMRELWTYKAPQAVRRPRAEMEEEDFRQAYDDRAGIFAEFGKIVCISVGVVFRSRDDQRLRLRLKSFASDDERELLEGFSAMLQQYYKDPAKCYLCGHNIKEFDIPYVCRRMVVNGLSFPEVLQITGKKPWETKHLLDTLELWKFGDYKNYTSLKLLAGLFGIPSPKDDIDGSDVGRVYWQEKDLPRIALYCEKDVLATVQLFLRYQLKPLLEEDQIEYIDRGAGEEE